MRQDARWNRNENQVMWDAKPLHARAVYMDRIPAIHKVFLTENAASAV